MRAAVFFADDRIKESFLALASSTAEDARNLSRLERSV